MSDTRRPEIQPGCSDINCVLRDNKIGTNGGCRCLRGMPVGTQRDITLRIQSLTQDLKTCREQLAARDAEVEQLRNALLEIANAGAQPNAWPAERARQALNGGSE